MKKNILLVFLFLLLSFTGIQDTQLYYKQAGEGETIIFVHGSQEDYSNFMPQLEQLKNDFRVITYSRRYNYPNTNAYKEGTPFNPMTEADDLERLVNAIGVEKFHLVGHSYGGLVAIAYANTHEERLKSLLVSEPPLLSITGCEESLILANKGLIEKVGTAFKTADSTLIMKSIFEFFVGADIQDELPPEALTALKANLGEMKALVSAENPFPNLNTEFNIPMMIVTTEYTMPILKCTNEMLVATTPNAKHVHIMDAGHDMWMTHQEVMSGHLKDFILKK